MAAAAAAVVRLQPIPGADTNGLPSSPGSAGEEPRGPAVTERHPKATEQVPTVEKDPKVMKQDPVVEQDPKVMEEDPRVMEQNPKMTEQDPKMMEQDPMVNQDPKTMEQDPRVMEQDPMVEQDPKVMEQDPKTMEQDPKMMEQDPKVMEQDPKTMEQDLKTMEQDPKVMEQDPMVEQDPRTMEQDPKATEQDPKVPGPDPAAVEAMLAAVAGSRLRVRSQQQGEPELTAAERRRELRELFRRKPLVFLERFHGALGAEHLGCFAHLGARYEVAFYCEEVRRAARDARRRRHRDTRRRNRRYAALQQLIQGGEYFSEEEMRAREPLLYEQYIGQYRDAEGAPAAPPGPTAAPHGPTAPPPALGPLAQLLLRSVEEAAVQQRLRGQRQREDACAEEEEESEEEGAGAGPDAWVPDVAERAMLRAEFTSRMHRRFLDGEDGDFDYSQVDDNPELDNLDIVSRDAEERYFDGEEPGAAPAPEPE